MLSQHGGGSGIEGSKATLGSGGPSIGNYKGVMLCNRPFAGVQAAANAATNSTKTSTLSAFRSGIPNEPLGLNPPKKIHLGSPKKKKTAIGKHKKWLKKIQEDRRSEGAAKLESDKLKARRLKRFKKRQENKRKDVTKRDEKVTPSKVSEDVEDDPAKYKEEDVDGYEEEEYEAKCAAADAKESKWNDNDEEGSSEEENDDKIGDDFSELQRRKITTKNKPAWAYTKEAKEVEDEELENAEVEDLLDFADNLDFEEFIDDLEVRHALKKLRERVSELTPRRVERFKSKLGKILEPKNVDSEELIDKRDEKEPSRPLTREALEELNKELYEELRRQRERDDDDRSVVSESSLLSDTKSLRSVHSAKSIAAIRKQITKRKKLEGLKEVREGSVVDASVYEEPVVVVNDGEKGKISREAARLPYIRRNPAV